MENIIPAVDRVLLKNELTPDKMLRRTNKAGNEIYVITHHTAPNVMLEVGRLREIAFRDGGGGTGLSVDIDEYDTMPNPYYQLIVWDPDAQEIIGGYRFVMGDQVDFLPNGQPNLATSHLFTFSDRFLKEFLPYTVELGRSFVALDYQSSKAGAKALFALDNLWDGLGAIMVQCPQMKYFFGKVTMYSNYHSEARDLILGLCRRQFGDPDSLVTPIHPLTIRYSDEQLLEIFPHPEFKDNYKILNSTVRELGINIPPLFSSYMSLSSTMRFFGTALNEEFGLVEESGIMININDILASKKERHMESFVPTPEFRFKVQ